MCACANALKPRAKGDFREPRELTPLYFEGAPGTRSGRLYPYGELAHSNVILGEVDFEAAWIYPPPEFHEDRP